MPTAPPRVCARCGQPAPKGQPCQCRPAFEGCANPASTRRWRKLRAAKLRHDPICEADGCRRPAVEADHMQPLSQGGDRWDRANLASLCREHHIAKSVIDAQRGRTRPR